MHEWLPVCGARSWFLTTESGSAEQLPAVRTPVTLSGSEGSLRIEMLRFFAQNLS